MTIALAHVCDLVVELSPPLEMGISPVGVRRIIPIVGGKVSGPLLSGRILPVGADWQTVLKGGIADLDARYAIETGDGAIVEVVSQGVRHASEQVHARIASGEDVASSEYYMRTAIRLESGHPAYEWVNRSLFLAEGGKVANTVRLQVYRAD